MDGLDGMGLGWISLKALILRAPLCGANKTQVMEKKQKEILQTWGDGEAKQIYFTRISQKSITADPIFFAC